MNRQISILTLFALLMNLVACAGSPSNTDTNPQTSDDTTATQADSTDYAPTLPKVDMKEETYTVFSQGWWGHNYLTVDDISVEDINGDVVNDAVYRRKGDIEEEYNCILEHHNVDDPDTALKDFNTSVMAGDNSFDIALMRSNVYNTLLSSGSLLDLSTVPNVNLTAPYYDPQSYTDLAIADKHCGIVSNITMQSYMSLFSVYFNKVMHADYQLDDMYTLVRDGSWTIDKLHEYSKLVAEDVNKDGIMERNDRFGAFYVIDVIEGFINASDMKLAKAEKGEIVMTHNTESSMTKLLRLFDFMSDTNSTINLHARKDMSSQIGEIAMFTDRHALFAMAGIYYAPQFRQMEDDYGIIPMPKYNEEQDGYITPIFANLFPVTVIPRTNNRLENTGILMEELSYRGYKDMLPAVYDMLLTGKCTRDDDSVEILDIIFENTSYDIGMIFDFGGLRSEIRNLYMKLDNSFASTFAELDAKIDENIDTLIKAVNQ